MQHPVSQGCWAYMGHQLGHKQRVLKQEQHTQAFDEDWTMFGTPSLTKEYQQLSVNTQHPCRDGPTSQACEGR
jgi:hypothetical protein